MASSFGPLEKKYNSTFAELQASKAECEKLKDEAHRLISAVANKDSENKVL